MPSIGKKIWLCYDSDMAERMDKDTQKNHGNASDRSARARRRRRRRQIVIVQRMLIVFVFVAAIGLIIHFVSGRGKKNIVANPAPEAAEMTANDTIDVVSEAVQAEKEAVREFSVSFTTTGDLIFWREVADYIDMNGGASAMEGIADLIDDADVTISDLESPLSNNDSVPLPEKDVYIIGRPGALEGMKNAGIDVVSLANNHIMDYSGPALEDTIHALDEAGILHAGAGMTESDADAVLELEVNGASIAFFSWTDIVPHNFIAYGDAPGVASARLNMDSARSRIREAKETHDIVIVAIHWGIEYQDYISDELQRTPAHQFVEAGADIILGNHPHVPEGIEFYQGSLIAYAHGNCVFRQDPGKGYTHESYIMDFTVTQDGISDLVVTPLYLSDDYGIPGLAQGDQAQSTLVRLTEISEGMNSAFEIRDGKAYVTPIEPAANVTPERSH